MSENKMGVMSEGRLLLTMSVPAILSMLIQAFYNVIDSIFVAQLGENALTAISLVFPVQMLLVAVGVGTGVGINSLIARRLGERNVDSADDAATHGFILAVVNWIVFAVFGLFFVKPFLSAFSDSTPVIEYGAQYLS
ncbi:MAG: MATE family efflux transporter, partial [Eubacteriales bacterium]|nr:MATE family efflux transporter [Eubacteriales bacterium]